MDSESVQDISHTLQYVPGQIATCVMDLEGHILAATGDLKDSNQQAVIFCEMIQRCEVVTTALNEPLKRIVVSFKNYQYAVSLAEDKVLVVKTSIE